jgi:hypothetical protein
MPLEIIGRSSFKARFDISLRKAIITRSEIADPHRRSGCSLSLSAQFLIHVTVGWFVYLHHISTTISRFRCSSTWADFNILELA